MLVMYIEPNTRVRSGCRMILEAKKQELSEED